MKKKSNKSKKVEFTLWENDLLMLQRYSEKTGMGRSVAIRHLVREGLKNYAVESSQEENKNQLDLFDSVQIDIFNNTSKTE